MEIPVVFFFLVVVVLWHFGRANDHAHLLEVVPDCDRVRMKDPNRGVVAEPFLPCFFEFGAE